MTLAIDLPRPARGMTTTETRLWAFAGAIALAALPVALAFGLDARQFNAEPIWLKPLKFHLALAVYFGTLALFARWLPARFEQARAWRWFLGAAMAATVAELVWIGGAAALGVGSHFNTATPLWQAVYGLMGLLATVLTALTLVMGVAVWRDRASPLPDALRMGLALGLVLTFALTMLAAWGMAAGPGHLVGVPVTGGRVPLMGWSLEVGDLRLPHFLATHALHVVPLAGFIGLRAVWLAGAGYTALTLWALGRAQMGLPLLF
jgi:hypothetical protein